MYIGENVVIKGNVVINQDCSIWHNAVIRADMESVTIGSRTNIQDLVMIHTGNHYPVNIGHDVTVGHSAIIHGCTIGNHTMIGMGAIIMNGAMIGDNCIVAAGSLITQKKVFEDGTLIMGHPAKAIRKLTEAELTSIQDNTDHYIELAERELKKTEEINH